MVVLGVFPIGLVQTSPSVGHGYASTIAPAIDAPAPAE
jgi:hypothetical protein